MEGKQKPIDTTKIYPSPNDQGLSEKKQQITAPLAMADLEIMKAESTKSAADHNPEIRNIALLLGVVLGITLFSQISSSLIVRSFANTHASFFSIFVSSIGLLGMALLLIQIIAIFVLLFARNTSHIKTMLLVAGIGFGVTLVKSVVGFHIGPTMIFNVAVLVVNFLILRKIFRMYLDL